MAVSIPGSGKTTAVTKKIAHILHQRPDARIVAITFTREAAKELAARAIKEAGKAAASRLTTGTFHSIALHHVMRHLADRRAATPRIVMGAEQRQYMLRAIELMKHSDEPNRLPKDIKPDDAITAVERLRARFSRDEATWEFELSKEYEKLLVANSLTDFPRLMFRTTEAMLTEQMPMLDVTHMLVDEAQDIDEVQWQFAVMHATDGKAIVDMVGDDDQTIYSFRQALGYQGMTKFQEKVGAHLIRLDTNFRCKSEILMHADEIIRNNKKRLPKEPKAARGPGSRPKQIVYQTREVELRGVADLVATEFKAMSSSIAILARTNDLLQLAEGALREQNLPFRRVNQKSSWNEEPVTYLLAFLRWLEFPSKIDGIGPLLYWAGLSNSEVTDIGKALTGERFSQRTAEKALASVKAKWPKIFEMMINECPKWQRAIETKNDTRIAAAIRQAAGYAGLLIPQRKKAGGDTSPEYRDYCRASFDFCGGALAKSKGTITNRIQACTSLDKTDSGSEHAVTLVSMHSSKGLEYDSVFIVGCEQRVIPGKASTEDEIAEETTANVRRDDQSEGSARLVAVQSPSPISHVTAVGAMPVPAGDELLSADDGRRRIAMNTTKEKAMDIKAALAAKPWGKDKRLVAIAGYGYAVCAVLGGAGGLATIKSIATNPQVMLAGAMAVLTAVAVLASIRNMLAYGRCGRNITVAVVGALTYVMIISALGSGAQNLALVASCGFVGGAAAYFMSPKSQLQFNPPDEDEGETAPS